RKALPAPQKSRQAGFPARPDGIFERMTPSWPGGPGTKRHHATCPCLANTRCFLPLISLVHGPGEVARPMVVAHSSWFSARGATPPRTHAYLMILETTPAPTVRPPSRIAKRRPSSIAIGLISVTTIFTLSPG